MVILGDFTQFVRGVGAQPVQPQPPFADQLVIDVLDLDIAGKINQPGQVMVIILDSLLRAVLLDLQIFQKISFGF